jgi:hypothetical protein
MNTISKKYIKIIENKKDNNNKLSISVYYDIGGYNLGTHKEKPRGYYISVTPVERWERNGLISESITAFTGYYDLLKPCNRKSKKAEAEALEKAPASEKMLIEYITTKNGYILEG